MSSEIDYSPGRKAPQGLEYLAMVIAAAIDIVSVRAALNVAALPLALSFFAEPFAERQLARLNAAEVEAFDPVLAEVGPMTIRASEVAVIAANGEAAGAGETIGSAPAVVGSSVVEELTDQAALAIAAEKVGIDRSLELRAKVALARREILASAYLDRVVDRALTEESLREAYTELALAAAADQKIGLRRITVGSADEAMELRDRILAGARFDEMARRRSLDMATRNRGGDMGVLRVGDLPAHLADHVAGLALGDVSTPVRNGAAYDLVVVEVRHSVRMPDFESLRPLLEAQLRDSVVAETIASARAAVPVKERPAQGKDGTMILPTAAALSAAW